MKQISDELFNSILTYMCSVPPNKKTRDIQDQMTGYKSAKENYLLFAMFPDEMEKGIDRVTKVQETKDALMAISARKEVYFASKLGLNQLLFVFDTRKSKSNVKDAICLALHDMPRIVIPVGMPIESAGVFLQESLSNMAKMIVKED